MLDTIVAALKARSEFSDLRILVGEENLQAATGLSAGLVVDETQPSQPAWNRMNRIRNAGFTVLCLGRDTPTVESLGRAVDDVFQRLPDVIRVRRTGRTLGQVVNVVSEELPDTADVLRALSLIYEVRYVG